MHTSLHAVQPVHDSSQSYSSYILPGNHVSAENVPGYPHLLVFRKVDDNAPYRSGGQSLFSILFDLLAESPACWIISTAISATFGGMGTVSAVIYVNRKIGAASGTGAQSHFAAGKQNRSVDDAHRMRQGFFRSASSLVQHTAAAGPWSGMLMITLLFLPTSFISIVTRHRIRQQKNSTRRVLFFDLLD